MRRRSVVSLVTITVIATVAVTVAVVYAVQQIFLTREVGATASIQPAGSNLGVCGPSDPDCLDPNFTGPLDFGEMLPSFNGFKGSTRTVVFYISCLLYTSPSPRD